MNTDTLQTWPLNWKIIRYQARYFSLHSLFVVLVFGLQIVPGLIIKQIFDTISGAAPTGAASMFGIDSLWWLIGLMILVELARLFFSIGATWFGETFFLSTTALLRRNLFASILRRPGDQPLPVSSGEAINRFEEDVGEVSDFPTWLPDQAGKWLAAIVAIGIMASINLTITLVIFIPLFAISMLTRLTWDKVIFYRKASGWENDRVSGFMVEVFGAVQAVKIANAESHIAARLQRLNEGRAQADIRHWTYRSLLDSVNSNMLTFGIGVMLLLGGSMISNGTFTVGDFALFVSYLWFATQAPTELGSFIGDYKTQAVSIERMLAMIRPDPAEVLVEHHPVYERGPIPDVIYTPKTDEDRLENLEVRGLTYQHSGNGVQAGPIEGSEGDTGETGRPALHGIEGIDLAMKRGDFVVITGRVGSGKSTLVRVLLGLLPRLGGQVRWNGQVVENLSDFFQPPRCAFTPQVPRLFSDSLRENILMGLPEERVDLPGAIHLSVLEQDVGALEKNLDTLVGPRGVRLSGGQVQRAAAARMFVRQPELLVFDDLSSALDVETEKALWERIDEQRRTAEAGLTCLVVSHRREALARADQIVLLKDGRVEAEGRLEELLENSAEMRRIWWGDRN